MNNNNVFETILGAVVLAFAGLFIVFAYTSADLRKVQGYIVSANFPMIDGIMEGTDVKINGVKVGSISSLTLNTKHGNDQFLVTVSMSLRNDVDLPEDTIAMVANEGLLGGKYMSLEPGIEDDIIKKDGTGRIVRTQAPLRFDDLIGKLIYGSTAASDTSSHAAAGAQHGAAETPGTASVQ
ncbi:MAG: MlaD family protein [Alphaproteobacteria bacterium]|nr:MlaD family protein [Alphaproteobacteria bacterium]MCL2505778.1 MlaD family protein [Alphaproteobacteria bacterium]